MEYEFPSALFHGRQCSGLSKTRLCGRMSPGRSGSVTPALRFADGGSVIRIAPPPTKSDCCQSFPDHPGHYPPNSDLIGRGVTGRKAQAWGGRAGGDLARRKKQRTGARPVRPDHVCQHARRRVNDRTIEPCFALRTMRQLATRAPPNTIKPRPSRVSGGTHSVNCLNPDQAT